MSQRPLKLRAWDKRTNTMWYPRYISIGSHGSIPCVVSSEEEDFEKVSIDDIPCNILMQFTGLHDSKRTEEYPEGQEIYEGDIVKALIYADEEPQILPVYYDVGAFWIDYEDSESDRVPIGCFLGSLEVIGNIHENPELLEKP